MIQIDAEKIAKANPQWPREFALGYALGMEDAMNSRDRADVCWGHGLHAMGWRSAYRLYAHRDAPPVRNARFWAWINDDWCKITLKPGQLLRRTQGGPTDEGYSWTNESWEHQGMTVKTCADADARDCDGRVTSQSTYECPLDRLDCHPVQPLQGARESWPKLVVDMHRNCPDWQKISHSQRDYVAENAGY